MTPARRQNISPQSPPLHASPGGELGPEAPWPAAYRALLLLSEAAHPADPALARISDDDMIRLRSSLALLSGGESTSIA